MTHKELLYFEDAIGHEDSIIAICKESIKKLKDENLVSFLEKEVTNHEKTRDKLMNYLEEVNND